MTKGMDSFDYYEDPETGKQGKVNVGVTVGPYRGHKLVGFLAPADSGKHNAGSQSCIWRSLDVFMGLSADSAALLCMLTARLQLEQCCMTCDPHARQQ